MGSLKFYEDYRNKQGIYFGLCKNIYANISSESMRTIGGYTEILIDFLEVKTESFYGTNILPIYAIIELCKSKGVVKSLKKMGLFCLYLEKQACSSLFKIRGRSNFDPFLKTLLWPSSGTGEQKYTTKYVQKDFERTQEEHPHNYLSSPILDLL